MKARVEKRFYERLNNKPTWGVSFKGHFYPFGSRDTALSAVREVESDPDDLFGKQIRLCPKRKRSARKSK